MSSMQHCYTHINSPLGKVLLISDGKQLTGLYFEGQRNAPALDELTHTPKLELFAHVSEQLIAYFAGTRTSFDIPCALTVGTKFQQQVWNALSAIPHNSTISYQQLATQLGMPTGCRTVASAVARNPISIIIPCHRVIGSNGSLMGYAGGIERKQMLLNIEQKSTLAPVVAKKWPLVKRQQSCCRSKTACKSRCKSRCAE